MERNEKLKAVEERNSKISARRVSGRDEVKKESVRRVRSSDVAINGSGGGVGKGVGKGVGRIEKSAANDQNEPPENAKSRTKANEAIKKVFIGSIDTKSDEETQVSGLTLTLTLILRGQGFLVTNSRLP